MNHDQKVRVEYRDVRSDKTRIDAHMQAAMLVALLGCFPVALYWFSFRAFGTSQLPWKIASAIVTLGAMATCASYLFNRRTRRLFWEGLAAAMATLIFWLMFGSYWLFYFTFAPMPFCVRGIALACFLSCTSSWIWMSWCKYQRATVEQDLISKLYVERPDRIVYPGAESDATVSCIASPWGGLSIPHTVFTIAAPLIIGYAFVSQRILESGGPHGVFIILSILSLPLSNGILGQMFIRTIFFHVFLALKLEGKTGKKVILGP